MIPKYAKTAKPVTIDDLRRFIAPFGQDIAVLMTWNNKDSVTNLVTAGSARPKPEKQLKKPWALTPKIHSPPTCATNT